MIVYETAEKSEESRYLDKLQVNYVNKELKLTTAANSLLLLLSPLKRDRSRNVLQPLFAYRVPVTFFICSLMISRLHRFQLFR